MLTINGQLCYSPHPPERYTLDGRGHGRMVRHNLQCWNLTYLSCPIVDKYLEPGTKLDDVWREGDVRQQGYVAALVVGQAARQLWPQMQDMLRYPPHMFLDYLKGSNWRDMPPNSVINEWMGIVEERVNIITFSSVIAEVENDLYKRLKVKR